eukprot:13587153-Ditylum_brightwellii.AAC.1
MIRKSKSAISNVVSSVKFGKENVEFTEQGIITQCLGIKVIKLPIPKNKSFDLCQPYLIKKIVELIGLTPDVKGKGNSVRLPLLHKNLGGLKH